jgi:hypothetical protein
MGFFSTLFSAAANMAQAQKPVEVVIPFDADWFDTWEALRIKQEANPFPVDVKISFDEELLKEIWNSIEGHSPTSRVLYDDEQQPINNVGESFRQPQIEEFCGGQSAEDLDWLAGFLLPEMANPYDKTAVAIYAMRPTDAGIDSEVPFKVLHGGYMDKESAKKVHKKILNLMGKNQFIPLLIRVVGGTPDKPSYGVFAYAKTKAITFP